MSNVSLRSTRTMLTAWDTVSLIKIDKGPGWEVVNNSHVIYLVMMIIIQ